MVVRIDITMLGFILKATIYYYYYYHHHHYHFI
jgi:hypothetical protein